MADNPNNDLVNLDEATASAEAASGDTILNAAEIFQQQLEQMTTWKQQLGQQMDLMRKDGIKLLERQKALAQDRKAIADDRATLTSEREQIQKLQAELNAETQRLSQ